MRNSGLYIHVPFCERKCGYCSFYSVGVNEGLAWPWLECLEREASYYSGAPVSTLYIGGGTPSTLTLEQWHKLINIITTHFDLSGLIEASVEANPNSLRPEHLRFWKDNHITRISLGVQSLNDRELATLGRLHDVSCALRAMERVRDEGFNLSCDLIFAIPGQTLRTWDKSLRQVINFAGHVSTYQLTLEPDTPLAEFYGNDELNTSGYKFYRYAQYLLPRLGFTQYEISSFSPPGHECHHNLAYWSHSDVIALGPSAVGYIDGVRLSNPKTLNEYLKGTPPSREELSPHDKAIELAILSLRTRWGISRKNMLPEIDEVLSGLPDDLFVRDDERVALSQKGMRVGNAVWCELIGL